MQRHFQALVEVLVVHVVDAVHGVDIGARQPLHHVVELRHHVVIVEHIAAQGGAAGATGFPLTSSRPPLMA